jgi:hypothetical protein
MRFRVISGKFMRETAVDCLMHVLAKAAWDKKIVLLSYARPLEALINAFNALNPV